MISLETFKLLVSSLEQLADDRDAIASDRRSSPRVRCAGMMTILLLDSKRTSPMVCEIHDLSFGGVCICRGNAMTVGARFILVGGSSGQKRAVLCSVSHSRRRSSDPTENSYLIGASFVRELDWHGTAPPARDQSGPAGATDLFESATFEDPSDDS